MPLARCVYEFLMRARMDISSVTQTENIRHFMPTDGLERSLTVLGLGWVGVIQK